jgi:hypothetical protein
MKKLFILLLISSSCIAQETEADYFGKIFPAKVLYFSSPQVQEVQMRFENPLYFSDRNAEFLIDNKKINCALIEAFTADVSKWTRKLDPSPNWGGSVADALAGKSEHITMARLGTQGAIESYAVYYKGIGGGTIETPYMRKLNGKVIKGTLSEAENFIREWVADSPEISRELRQADSLVASNQAKIATLKKNDSLAKVQNEKDAKRKGLAGWAKNADDEKKLKDAIALVGHSRVQWGIIIINYNVWYNQKNPGKIKYYFEDPQTRYPSQLESHIERENRINAKSVAELEKEAAQKKLAELYANRSTSVSAEYASAKNNEPVKKETFAAKLDRIKADGNKVGVLFVLNSVQSPPQTPPNQMGTSSLANSMSTDYFIEGDYMDETLSAIGEQFTSEINKALGRNDIELINLEAIPYKNAKVMGMSTRVNNFWASKYKLIFIVTISPLIKASVNESAQKNKHSAFLNLVSSLMVKEYIGNPESTDSDIVAQMPNYGSFSTSSISQNEAFTTIETVYKQIVEKQSTSIIDKARTEREQDLKKLIEKKLK